mmetsp:Transcript_40531/g.39052  ORF Transcript_40531/g.39052 Transcript_40531/m.39052 type:complete len:185 (+) Transcript_40531:3-557(+)
MSEEEKKEKLQEQLESLINQVSSFNIKSNKRNIGFVFNTYTLLHFNDEDHPERPSRLMSIYSHLEKKGLLKRLEALKCPKIDPKDLESVHTKEHIDYVLETSKQRQGQEASLSVGNDVYVNEYSGDAALISAGGTVEGLKALAGENPTCQGVFAAVRPPGHHACSNQAAGFCFFNNVAVAARYA